MSEKQTRRSYDREFKISAVKLVLDSGRSVKSIAEDLGISDNTLFIRNGFPLKIQRVIFYMLKAPFLS